MICGRTTDYLGKRCPFLLGKERKENADYPGIKIQKCLNNQLHTKWDMEEKAHNCRKVPLTTHHKLNLPFQVHVSDCLSKHEHCRSHDTWPNKPARQ